MLLSVILLRFHNPGLLFLLPLIFPGPSKEPATFRAGQLTFRRVVVSTLPHGSYGGQCSSRYLRLLRHLGGEDGQCPPPDVCSEHLERLRDVPRSFLLFFLLPHSFLVFSEHPALPQGRLLEPGGLWAPLRAGRCFQAPFPDERLGYHPVFLWSERGESCPPSTQAGATGVLPRLLGDGELKASLSAWPGRLHRPLPGRSHHLWVPSSPCQLWPALVSPPQTPSPSLLIPV